MVKTLPALPDDVSLYGLLVVLARAGWYATFRLDNKAGSGTPNVGLWLDRPYWLGMPVANLNYMVGWFSTTPDARPHEIGVRCAGLQCLRPALLRVWNDQLRSLSETFHDSVPHHDGRSGFSADPIAGQYLKDWQPGGSKHARAFSPHPMNLPEITDEWLEKRSLSGRSWDHEHPGADLSAFPARLTEAGMKKGLPFTPEWGMATLQFSAMTDYGRRCAETWEWTARNFVSHFQTPDNTYTMLPRANRPAGARHERKIAVPAADNAWNDAIEAMVEETLSNENEVYTRGETEASVFRVRDKRKE